MHKCLKKLKNCERIFSHKELEYELCSCGITYSEIIKVGDACLLILKRILPKIDLL